MKKVLGLVDGCSGKWKRSRGDDSGWPAESFRNNEVYVDLVTIGRQFLGGYDICSDLAYGFLTNET